MRYHLVAVFFLLVSSLRGQGIHPPMDLPPLLSGTFGELRSNHFHAGIDMKTEGREGQPVRAVWSGYVSRIKVSPYGYGNAIYVAHPNGKTTVYAHLQRFNTEIQAYVRRLQYSNKSFSIDQSVPPGRLPLEQDELLGLSGNSGGSGGPHLHFEIRDSKTQHALNALKNGIDKTDDIPPIISGVRIVNLNEHFHTLSHRKIESGKTYDVSSSIGIEVNSFDRLNGANNRNGIYSLELYVDSQKSFQFVADNISFNEKRYINALNNYNDRACCRSWWTRTYSLPGNRLKNQSAIMGDGVLRLDSGETRNIEIKASDANGNVRNFQFTIRGNGEVMDSHFDSWLDHRKSHKLQFFGGSANIPRGVLYKDAPESYSLEKAPSGTIGPAYKLLSDSIAAHKTYKLTLPLDSIKESLWPQTVVVHVSKSGRYSSEGGQVKSGAITTRVRSFGRFALAIDSTAPRIKPISIKEGIDLSKKQGIVMVATDDLSGIDSWEVTINQNWHLCEYDAKSNRFYIPFEDRIPSGMHYFEFKVRDGVGNEAVYSAHFFK